MYMQIKDLAQNPCAQSPSSRGRAVQYRLGFFSAASLCLCVKIPYLCSLTCTWSLISTPKNPLFHHFSNPKNCIIMHFSPKTASNMHYNALFHTPRPAPHPITNSQSLLYVLNNGGVRVGDALHQIGKRLDNFGALVHQHLNFHLLRLADVVE
jgi:hypothetical protein